MGKLQLLGEKTGTDKAHLHYYLDFYEQHLPKNPKRLLEIGVANGASLEMWRDYYPNCEVVGIDNGGEPIQMEGVTALYMDSKDVEGLRSLGKFDIIIDDGSHFTLDQQISFMALFPYSLNPGGVYVMEDLHCAEADGQYRNSKFTTMEILERYKNVLYWHREGAKLESHTAIIPKQ